MLTVMLKLFADNGYSLGKWYGYVYKGESFQGNSWILDLEADFQISRL